MAEKPPRIRRRVPAKTLWSILGMTVFLASPLWSEDHWPSFRGPQASGISPQAAPVSWDLETGENIAWRTSIPGLGLSSPIVWGDHLFVTTAVSTKDNARLRIGLYGEIKSASDRGPQSWRIYCLDRNTGEILWHQVAHEGAPKTQRHTKASHANSTPVTDGERVIAHFGSEGLYAWDFDGKLLWKKDFGTLVSSFFRVPDAEWGYASSPIIHGDTVFVINDVVGESYLWALDVSTGEEKWRAQREDVPSWATPTVVETAGRSQVVVNGFNHMGGYDLETGKELWRLSGGGDIPVPTPVFADGLIYLASAHGPAAPVFAVHADAKGDISLGNDETSNTFVAWRQDKVGVYMQTPLVYHGKVFASRDSGVLHVFDAKTGKLKYKGRVTKGSAFTASPVAAGGKIYFTAETGEVHILEAEADELTTVGVSSLGELSMATPAIVDGTIYFRTRRYITAVGDKVAEKEVAGEEAGEEKTADEEKAAPKNPVKSDDSAE